MPLWSHDQRESMWQFEKSISPLSQNLWPLNLAARWLQQGDSARKALSHHRLLICNFDCKVKFYFSPRRHLKRWGVFVTLNIYIIFIYIYIQRGTQSCYRKLAWVGLESLTTEFCSETLRTFITSTGTQSQLCTPTPI